MTPKRLVHWVFTLCVATLAVFVTCYTLIDLSHSEFPRLQAILGIQNGRLLPLLIVGAAAAVATFVVFFFSSTRGRLEFRALGISFSGPSGPILLWAVVFICVAVVISVIR